MEEDTTPGSDEVSSSSDSPQSPSQGYDAAVFTQEHQAFKDECTAIFVQGILDLCSPRCNVAYLDDYDGKSIEEQEKHLRTSKALLEGGVSPQRLYLANPDEEICGRLHKYSSEAHAFRGFFVDAMDQWGRVSFEALYLDLCAGSSEVVLENLSAALPRLDRTCFLGFTFTRRDANGDTSVERQYKIENFLRENGFERSRHSGLKAHGGVYTQFYARC